MPLFNVVYDSYYERSFLIFGKIVNIRYLDAFLLSAGAVLYPPNFLYDQASFNDPSNPAHQQQQQLLQQQLQEQHLAQQQAHMDPMDEELEEGEVSSRFSPRLK